MPTRTYLTTPPGRAPSSATGRSPSRPPERYVPGLAQPREPRLASRGRNLLLAILALAVVAAVTVVVVRASAGTRAEDPVLEPPVDTVSAPAAGWRPTA